MEIEHGICLLSLDAGGARAVSQLTVLAHLMEILSNGIEEGATRRPCQIFDLIGGTGSGGFIAILLAVLEFTAEQALDEFLGLSVSVLAMQGEPQAKTTALQNWIDPFLQRHKIKNHMRLMNHEGSALGCKLVIPISYKRHIESTCLLRNFPVRHEQTPDLTVREAMLVTLSSPPLFLPTSIRKDAATFEYVGGDLLLSNPVRQIITEAYAAFGPERQVAALVSLGCGHPGFTSIPESSDAIDWNQLLSKVVTNSEKEAQMADAQMGHLRLYHRFSVNQGLEISSINFHNNPEDTITQTIVYLNDGALLEKIEYCLDSIRLRDGTSSLEQLKRSGGAKIEAPPLPFLTDTFVIRKEPWEFIQRTMLSVPDAQGPAQQKILIITGMGGCGKTQITRKFIDEYQDRFTAVLFIDGSNEDRIRADLIRNVRYLSAEHSQMSFKDCLGFLSRPVEGKRHLIVYDNVDDPELELPPLLPPGGNCAIIITSRNRSVGDISRRAHLELDVMSEDEAVELVLRDSTDSSLTREEACAISGALGYLPIALVQARSYIFQTRCSGKAYLEKLSSSRKKLLAQPIRNQRDVRYNSTYAAFSASFELLSTRNQRLLWLFSYFHWSRFPLELVTLAVKHDFHNYDQEYVQPDDDYYGSKQLLQEIFTLDGVWDDIDWDARKIALQSCSLITLVKGYDTMLLEMHPLVHEWVHLCIPEEDRTSHEASATLLLALGARTEHGPSTQYLAGHVTRMYSLWDRLNVNEAAAFGHILHHAGLYDSALLVRKRVVEEIENHNVHPMSTPFLLGCLAETYCRLGRFSEAEPLLVDALERTKLAVGEQDPSTLTAISSLAELFRRSDRLKDAEALHAEVLQRRRELLGDRHIHTILSMSNMALIHTAFGRLNQAKILQSEALEIMKETLGMCHLSTLTATGNLAHVYRDLGRYKDAEALDKEVLRIRREILGERHPDTIAASNCLAITYAALQQYEDAERLQLKSLVLMKEILGHRHPETICASANLASTYQCLGRLAEAETIQREILNLRKEIMGEDHTDTIFAVNDLALTYARSGRFHEAVKLQAQVLSVIQDTLGDSHPHTITAFANLALTYHGLGRIREARLLQLEVLRRRKEVLGDRHPHTVAASHELSARVAQSGGNIIANALEDLRSKEKIMGESHPETIAASRLLALLYCASEEYKKGKTLQRTMLRTMKQSTGEQDPDYIEALIDLARMEYMSGKYIKAALLQEEALLLMKDIGKERDAGTLDVMEALASTYFSLKRYADADSVYSKVFTLRTEVLGERHASTIGAMVNLAHMCQFHGKIAEAQSLRENVLALRKEVLDDRHPDTIEALADL